MQKVKNRSLCLLALVLSLVTVLSSGCAQTVMPEAGADTDISEELVWRSSLERENAQHYDVEFYEGGYSLISISDGSRYLLVPEGADTPDDLASGIIVLDTPVRDIYLAASAAMSSFAELDALDRVRFSGTRKSDWYIEEAARAMEEGRILFAGKYRAPDYEMIMAEKCSLSIQNTMILHTPDVKENLEKMGIPVMVDWSSYESDPLGRCEWVKLYGVLTGKSEEAAAIFNDQKEKIRKVSEELSGSDPGGGSSEKPRTAYFYISSNGSAVVRRGRGYIPAMIELAGGSYAFSDLGADDDSVMSSMNMQMEAFYEGACDADYLIYDTTIDGVPAGIDELIARAPVLAGIKAVKEDRVYCTGKNFYQESNVCGQMVEDLYGMFQGREDMVYLKHLK